MAEMLLGIGTGRCGTTSLKTLLNAQPGIKMSQERWGMPWKPDLARADQFIAELKMDASCAMGGDIGHYWLPYIPFLLLSFRNARVVCLVRERDKYIPSAIMNSKGYNLFTGRPNPFGTQGQFPVYPPMPVEDAFGRFWDEYHNWTEELVCSFPGQIRIYQTQRLLNSEEIQREFLQGWLGIENPVLMSGVCENDYLQQG